MHPSKQHDGLPYGPSVRISKIGENMLTPALRRSSEVASYLRLQHFPLANAYLCQDCNSICNNANQCPACASEVLMGLSAVLNRDADEMSGTVFNNLPGLAAASRNGSALAA